MIFKTNSNSIKNTGWHSATRWIETNNLFGYVTGTCGDGDIFHQLVGVKHMASTLEGVLVKFADRIAYINHDIDDACRAGILHPEDIPQDLRAVLGDTHSKRLNTMVTSIIEASTDRNEIRMQPEIQEATNRLRDFLFATVYTNSVAKAEEGRAKEMLGVRDKEESRIARLATRSHHALAIAFRDFKIFRPLPGGTDL